MNNAMNIAVQVFECVFKSQLLYLLYIYGSQLFITVAKYLRKQFKEEKIYFGSLFRGFSPWRRGGHGRAEQLTHGGQEAECLS
jgi:hypothetical protein